MAQQGNCTVGFTGCDCQYTSAYQSDWRFWTLVSFGSAISFVSIFAYFWLQWPPREDGSGDRELISPGDSDASESRSRSNTFSRRRWPLTVLRILCYTALPVNVGLALIVIGHLQFHEGGVRNLDKNNKTADEYRDHAFYAEYMLLIGAALASFVCAVVYGIAAAWRQRAEPMQPITASLLFLFSVRIWWVMFVSSYSSEVNDAYFGGLTSAMIIHLVVASIIDCLPPRYLTTTRGLPKALTEACLHVGLMIAAVVHMPCA